MWNGAPCPKAQLATIAEHGRQLCIEGFGSMSMRAMQVGSDWVMGGKLRSVPFLDSWSLTSGRMDMCRDGWVKEALNQH